ncbi:porin [Comamonas aquatica]|uniref:Outer membrane porin protein 32 n=1 Tax=Comamonas aquatica TaxID=225991 RepID=A0AA35DC27_9BURK|nr:porin [Comamonas aquatica]CAB5693900.1 Outer membrane porin protein 32 precursor [Comamonas aquatica]CAB5707892.1 Outer membrane porin protein 32 precursor [Comamonas aquatica]CAC9179297.1 Outer membrane porin protein 32 precursor [Comamonas aquatica]CAC9678905.1 Outer membrane porin protein 32 precursor [Comamonas aquatica]
MTKTTRVMLAVLAVCGTSAAMAQSSVNVYGRINTTVESQKTGSTSTSVMNSNSSYLGFRGTEDLGNGLKAGFQLEGNFGSDNGAGFNFQRHSEVNLSGNFGTVRLGKFNVGSYLATADYISMHNHDTGTSADALYAYVFPEGNQISYRSPEFSGVTAEFNYGFGEKATRDAGLPGTGITGTGEHKGAFDAALNYNNGPLGLGLGYTQAKTNDAGDSLKEQQLGLRASYTINSLTLGAYYQYYKADTDVFDTKRHAYRLAAMYTLGASEFHANVGRAQSYKGDLDGTKTSATQWTLGYNYNLSKRTKVYGYFTKINNGDDAAYGVTNAGDNFRSIAVGVRHLF